MHGRRFSQAGPLRRRSQAEVAALLSHAPSTHLVKEPSGDLRDNKQVWWMMERVTGAP